jgi:serine/threonine-protein kinase
MTPERWQRIAELFESALQQEPGQRAAFLAEACADDPELGREVERLLDSHEHAGGFGDAPAFRFGVTRPEGTLEAGSRLGRYEIRGFLAAGGMGEIYRAHDPQLGREVAIKILLPRGDIGRDQLARFEREARAVGALSHQNILAVYDTGVAEDVPYVVSELLDGETLRAILTRGPLPVDQALGFARQIVAGLTAAHDKGIVHRDLKPENLFVTNDGLVKILDFGLAKQQAAGTGAVASAAAGGTSLTGHGLVVGTAGYMSPEQARGQHADARSDVFAVGAVLYEMVTGDRAFTGDSAVETLHAILTSQPPALSQLTAPFDRIVPRCLDKDRERRFASMREIKAALETTQAMAGSSRRLEHGTQTARVVLAVLPFQNLSGDEDQEYFSDGLTDEMITQLGRLNPQRLGVIARTSAMKYKHARKSIDVIGRELGAAYILEGSIRRGSSRVRVSAQLIQVSDQTQTWAESYEREIGDMLALQSDVAHAIASEIRVQLTPAERVRLARVQPVVPGAYEAYLKGRYFWNRRSRDSLEKSIRHFERAIDIDPKYAAAYAGLADAYLTQLDYNYLPPRDAFALANQAVLEALRLDDTLAEPHTSLGHLRLHQFDWTTAEQEFKRAIELNPGYGTAHYYYGNLLAAFGRFDEALVEANRALELDPMSPNVRQNRLFILYLARRYEQALEQLGDTIEIDPTYTAIHYYLGLIYERQGKYIDALAAFRRVSSTSQNRGATVLAAVVYTHAMAGDRAEALRALEQLQTVSGREYVSTYDLALLHHALGNTDEACALLLKAYDDHSSFLPFLNVDARFDVLRADPRVQALVRRMNLVPAVPAATVGSAVVQGGSMGSGEGWLGKRRRAASAAILAAAIAVGLYLWSAPTSEPIGIGGAGRPAVAILAFDNPTGNASVDWLTNGIPDMLSIGLAQTSGLDVVSSRRTSELLREAGQPEKIVDRAQAFDVIRRAGAGAVVAGAVYQTGEDFRVDVRLEDLATSRLIAAASLRGADVFALADDLVGQLRGVLRVGEQPASRRIAEITTHSMEAFRLYTEGYAAVRGLRTNDARQALEAALRLNPGYALARVALSEAFEKFGDQKRAEEHLQGALALAGRLSERDRLLVEARAAHFAGQTDRTVRALEAFVARWPDVDTAWDLLVHAYGRDPALKGRELGVLERWRKSVPGPGAGHMHNHFGYAYLDAGRLADATASFEAYIRVSPKEPNAYDSFGEALMVASRPAEAIRSYEKALSLDPLFGGSIAGRSWALAMEGRLDDALTGIAELEDLGERGGIGWRHVHVVRAILASRAGRYRDAADTMERGLQLARRLQSAGLEVELRLGAALFAVETEQPSRARSSAREALNVLERNAARVEPMFDPSVLRSFAHFLLGLADVRTGRLASAERHSEAQRADDRVNDPRQVWWQHALAAEIAFARGDLGGAERLWRTGLPPRKMHFSMRFATTMFANQLPQRDWEARLQRARGDLAGAARTYQMLNTPSAETAWTASIEPRFVLERARLLRQSGDLQLARTEYNRFLDLWRSADPHLPELAEARRYVQR